MFREEEFFLRHQVLIVGVDHVVQHFGFRTLRDANELRELLVFVSRKTLRDIPRRRSGGITELITKLELAFELRPTQKRVDPDLELMRKLPRNDVSEVPESRHSGGSCKPNAQAAFANSGVNLKRRRHRVALLALLTASAYLNFRTRTWHQPMGTGTWHPPLGTPTHPYAP